MIPCSETLIFVPKYYSMRTFFFILYILLPFCLFPQNVEHYLDSLDLTIKNSPFYVSHKENEIKQLKKNLESASFIQDKYTYSKRIALEYRKYQADSAFHYLTLCEQFATQANNNNWQQESSLYKCSVYMLRSDFTSANRILSKMVSIEHTEPELHSLYAQIQLDKLLRIKNLSEPVDTLYFTRIWEQYSPYVKSDETLYTIYKTMLFGGNNNENNIRILSQIVRQIHHDTEAKAFLQYTISRLLEEKRDTTQALIYAICSAITDIRTVNNDSQSLLDVIQKLNNQSNLNDQLERLYNYTQHCSQNICNFKDLGRSQYLIQQQNQVHKIYLQVIKKKEQLFFDILKVSISILIVAVLALYVLYRKYNAKKKEIVQFVLKEEELKADMVTREDMITSQKRLIDILEADVHRKNSFFVEGMKMQIGILNRFSQIKKNILNLITTSQIREAKKLLNDSLLSNQETELLYDNFDQCFLSIYPDFVERFNKLLLPENQIVLEDKSKLTIELRIYALVCLGVTDSVSIAKLLNYSPQTIYNYRLKIRHLSAIPEKEFAKTVMNLYRVHQ